MLHTERARAGLIHLLCSTLVASLAMIVIFWIWHPGVLSTMQGVSQLVLILIAVDVTLGPLLTTIVFTPGKARHLLRLDLSLIVAVQLAALFYGLYTIYNARPVFVVFNIDRFTVVMASEVAPQSLERALQKGHAGVPLGRPVFTGCRMPEDKEAREEIMFSAMGGGPDLPHFPEWHLPLSEVQEDMRARAKDLAELQRINELSDAEWQATLDEHGVDPDNFGYLPVDANSRDGVAFINLDTGAFVGIAALTPNWLSKPSTPPTGD